MRARFWRQAIQSNHLRSSSPTLKVLLYLLLLTVAAVAVHGYHSGVEDAEVYNPGILKILHPQFFPFGAEFFQVEARLMWYPNLMAAFARTFHLSLDATLFFWHVLSIFLLLLACWTLAGVCFVEERARWAAVALVAALLTTPVAGTALYIRDEYLSPRSLTLFAGVFSIAAAMKRKYLGVVAWTLFSILIHPLMFIYGLSLIAVIIVLRDFRGLRRPATATMVAAGLLPMGVSFRYPSEAYRTVIQMRPYFFLLRWHWYEWLGIFGPLALLWWFGRLARRHGMGQLDLLCRALILYEAVYFGLAMIMTVPPRLIVLAHYQPMRNLQLVYLLLFVIMGGLVGKWALRDQAWRWLALFVPLCGVMFYVQCHRYPASPHIEWPGAAPGNDWLRAFAWIRDNTPSDAVFVLNPNHMILPGEDEHGFRALAQRSMLADAVKDSAPAAMFPDVPLAEHWEEQIRAQAGWEHFQAADFERLHREWGVTWTVLDQPGATALTCPYANRTLRVCKLN